MNRVLSPAHLLVASALTLASCSSGGGSGGADITAPAISFVRQNRTIDPTGATVDVVFNEGVAAPQAELPASYAASTGNILTATLQPDGRTVRLVLDTPIVPGDDTFDILGGTAASGSVDFTAQVTDGDTITVSDGATALTFEFTSGGGASPGNIEVDKGADAAACAAAFLAAVNAQTFAITAAAGGGNVVTLTNDAPGTAGNVALAETDAGNAMTLVGLTGGAGIADLAGNVIPTTLAGLTLLSTDALRPAAGTLAALAVEGFDNDTVSVTFSDDMIAAEVEDPANWTLEAPIGNAFDVSNAVIAYDALTRTATMTLGNAVVGESMNGDGHNLQTFGSVRVAFANARDLGGNVVLPTAVSSTIGGDSTPPTITVVAGLTGIDNRLNVVFSEPVKSFAFGDLYSGGTDPGPRLLLNDADFTAASGATGTITVGGDPADGDTIFVSDGSNTVTFEWESAGGVTGGNVSVAIASGDNNQMALNLTTAVLASALTVNVVTNNNQLTLTNTTTGTVGNQTIVVTGLIVVTATGMQGGTDAGVGQRPPVMGQFSFLNQDSLIVVDYTPEFPNTTNDTLEVYGIHDLAGNALLPVADQPLATVDTDPPALDALQTQVTAVANRNNDLIVVTFAEPMSPFHLLEPSNYSIPPIDLSNALFTQLAEDQVIITLNGNDDQNLQFGTNYTLSLVHNPSTPFRTAHGEPLLANDSAVFAADGDNAEILAGSVTAYVGGTGSPNSCVVVYPEAVDLLGAMNAGNYEINTVNPTSVVELNARCFRLNFAAPPTAGQMLDIAVPAATDLAGNPAAAVISVALGAADTTPPTAVLIGETFSGTGLDVIRVTYSEPVDRESALIALNYALFADGIAIPLGEASVNYNAESNQVVIRLPDAVSLRTTAVLHGVLSGMRDLSGNFLSPQPADVNIIGDLLDPGFLGPRSGFVNWQVDPTGRTVEVRFSEDVTSASVQVPANWTTSGPSNVLSVTRIAPHSARLTLSAALVPGETVGVVNLRDLAGNVESNLITVEPLQ